MLSLHHLELMDIRITIVEEERNGRGTLVLNCLDLEVTHFISTHSALDRPNQRALIEKKGASLVVQWLRICLPMQGTRVRALVWEDLTCRGATRPVSHNY